MRRFILFTMLAFLLLTTAAPSNGQTPSVSVYFDAGLTANYAYCPNAPAGTVIDTLYVVAEHFNIQMIAMEYKIEYPPSIMFLSDLVDPSALVISSSAAGIWIAWTTPQWAFDPFVVQRVAFIWKCEDCAAVSDTVKVVPFPGSGLIRAVNWRGNQTVEGVGSLAPICSTPIQNTTWGRLKELYR